VARRLRSTPTYLSTNPSARSTRHPSVDGVELPHLGGGEEDYHLRHRTQKPFSSPIA
jgi:hypothetical protein